MSRSSSQKQRQILFLLLSDQDFQPSVNAKAFIQLFNIVVSSQSRVVVATWGGLPPHWSENDSVAARWFEQQQEPTLLKPLNLKTINLEYFDYSGLVVPPVDGLVGSFVNDKIGGVIQHFAAKKRPICFIAEGSLALFSTKPLSSSRWIFEGVSMTAPSNLELIRQNLFAKHASTEDLIRLWGGNYSAAQPDNLHVVIDSNVVSAQNRTSLLLAIQTFVLLLTSQK
ncbi:uncharacterized protein BJ171DRAFT_641577 [Polychytrium aggregatum]|uniref:uncharacterized protein n=1 Tax=Polychytrium aggregatum TaxID=110093 RepID=UPI0022FEBA86|nr:uncharacterized protein BJ171DRAFT_641577 [Polychytrium aggregatum]KAI9206808.1 hypothetical protein BJ171DRAFT_641577 [Polychytrium aggregatum]